MAKPSEKTRRTFKRMIRDGQDKYFFAARQNFVRDVLDFIVLRKRGHLIEAESAKKSLDRAIKKARLDPDIVYFFFGDPDDPKDRQFVNSTPKAYKYTW